MILKVKDGNQWKDIDAIVGPSGPQGPKGDTGPAGSYTAGEGIDITNDVISAESQLPSYTTGDAGKVLAVNTNEDGTEWISAGSGGTKIPLYKMYNLYSNGAGADNYNWNPNYCSTTTKEKWIEIITNNKVNEEIDCLFIGDYNGVIPDRRQYKLNLFYASNVEDVGNNEYLLTLQSIWSEKTYYERKIVIRYNTSTGIFTRNSYDRPYWQGITLDISGFGSSNYPTLYEVLETIKNNYAKKSDIPADELPTISSGDAGKVLGVNSTEDGVEWITPSGGSSYTEIYINNTEITSNYLAPYREFLTSVCLDGLSNHPFYIRNGNYYLYYPVYYYKRTLNYGNHEIWFIELSDANSYKRSILEVIRVEIPVDGTSAMTVSKKPLNILNSGIISTSSSVKLPSGTATYAESTLANELTAIVDNYALKTDIPEDELPTIASGDAGKVLAVNSGETGVEWISAGGTTYTAGDGIAIDANNVISVNGKVFRTVKIDFSTSSYFSQEDEAFLCDYYNNVELKEGSNFIKDPYVLYCDTFGVPQGIFVEKNAEKLLFNILGNNTYGNPQITFNLDGNNQAISIDRSHSSYAFTSVDCRNYKAGATSYLGMSADNQNFSSVWQYIGQNYAKKSDIPEDELPAIATGDAGKVLAVNTNEDGTEWITPSGDSLKVFVSDFITTDNTYQNITISSLTEWLQNEEYKTDTDVILIDTTGHYRIRYDGFNGDVPTFDILTFSGDVPEPNNTSSTFKLPEHRKVILKVNKTTHAISNMYVRTKRPVIDDELPTYTAGTGIDITNGVISVNLPSAETEGF